MKPARSTTLCTAFFLVMLGAAFAQHVQTDFDHHANFSQCKTYSWQEINPANSPWDARINNAVDALLVAKGWTKVKSGGDVARRSDQELNATENTSDVLQRLRWRMGLAKIRGRRVWRLYHDRTRPQDGTLVVDLYDARTRQLIWRGSAEDRLSDKADKNVKNLDKGVANMFEAFPPGSARGEHRGSTPG